MGQAEDGETSRSLRAAPGALERLPCPRSEWLGRRLGEQCPGHRGQKLSLPDALQWPHVHQHESCQRPVCSGPTSSLATSLTVPRSSPAPATPESSTVLEHSSFAPSLPSLCPDFHMAHSPTSFRALPNATFSGMPSLMPSTPHLVLPLLFTIPVECLRFLLGQKPPRDIACVFSAESLDPGKDLPPGGARNVCCTN